MTPPVVPDALLRLLLPRVVAEPIAGDLAEEWHAAAHPSRARYWKLALISIAYFWLNEVRRLLEPQDQHISERAVTGDHSMRTLFHDFAYGARLMRRNPGFTAAAVATLALGIGATTAIFSIVNVLSLKPLNYRDSTRVAFVRGWSTEQQSDRTLSLADFVELQRRARSLDVAAYSYWSANMTGDERPERVQAYRVTSNTFDLLGVPPLLGRGFTPDEGRLDGRAVAVISNGLWQRRFGSNPAIIGRDVILDGRPHTIVAVMPGTFEYPVFNFKGDLWAPLRIDPDRVLADRPSADSAVVVARIRSGVPYATAQAELDTLMRQLAANHPQTNRALGVRLTEMQKLDDEHTGAATSILLATVACVLLLACANVANLLLARGVARQRELAVRFALGAARPRIVRQLLAESLLLGLAGGAAGAAVAYIALEALRGALPEIVLTTQPNLHALTVNREALAFTLALSIGTSLLFGLVPAWRASRAHMQDALKESGAVGGSASTRRMRAALVVAEVMLSTALMIVAGLLVRSYQNQQHLDPGFNADQVVTMTVSLPAYRYRNAAARQQFFYTAADRIGTLPGVRAAAFTSVLPFSTYNRYGRFVPEGLAEPEAGREPRAEFRIVTPDLFRALEILLSAGRAFDARDRADGQPVAIVNRTLLKRFFDGKDPVGRRMRIVSGTTRPGMVTIVGVVGDVRHTQLTDAPEPEVYVPAAQSPVSMMMLAARVDGDPAAAIEAIRAEIQKVDPAQPVYYVKTLRALVSESLMPKTSAAAMMVVFGALALLLAGVGIYGVISYAVSQQMREFAVRLALGAKPADLYRLVLRQGLSLVLAGVVLGGLAAIAVSRLLSGALYGVAALDPMTYVAATALLGAVGLTACSVPAWRAGRAEPMGTLRSE